ncbi:hypothetical protein L2W58_04805 [Dethiosulfovibrio sp. F2B]|uniref:hypothetical protein n=1 Tax=Dethiosulfovibrio faecalis TaxID=2720018 RepID=UPI001F3188CB|nr:hypothetical protein [Dethiosulfovibrio faecalis]MCF4151115.1 hypothetical protein [Dethiosulfovibrio faecalis]
MKGWKSFLLVTLLTATAFCGTVAGINYMVDPLWCFDHEVLLGKNQPMFDERQQKTDWLTFHDVDYDTLIFGNSRVSYLDSREVPGRAFNYSCGSMRSTEYLDYAKYAKEIQGGSIKCILLGVSFYDTNMAIKTTFKDSSWYIDRANSVGFRYRSLLSLNLMLYSLEAIKRDADKNTHDAYFRCKKNILAKRMSLPIDDVFREKAIKAQINRYRAEVYGGSYVYNGNKASFEKLKEKFPDTKIYVFITPVTVSFVKLLISEGRWEDYKRWVKDLVDVFGAVWNFMYVNDVTENIAANFKDAHHYSPEVAAIIAKKVYDLPTPPEYDSFGIKMTRESLSSDIRFLEKNLKGILQ